MSEEILNKIKEKEEDLKSTVWGRQDGDVDLYLLSEYFMRDSKGNTFSKAHHVTLNNPAVFLDYVVSSLSSASEMVEIRQNRQKEEAQITDIENFSSDIDYEIDTRLNLAGQYSMSAIQWNRVCLRGGIGSFLLIQTDEDGKGLDITARPLDYRNFPHEYGDKQLEWGAPVYYKTKKQIEREYGAAIAANCDDKRNAVRDYWDSEKNIVFVDDLPVYEQENTLGYPPFVFQYVPTGAMIDDEKAFSHKGESVFWLLRGIYPELNRMATIMATIAQKTGMPDFQENVTDPYGPATKENQGREMPTSDSQQFYETELQGKINLVPQSDINNAVRLWWSVIRDLEQKGGLSDINYGNLTFPLPNSAIVNLMAARDKILRPRFQTYALYKRAMLRMIIDQVLKTDLTSFTIGEEGHQRTYKPEMFDCEYSIHYRFTSMSKETMLADSNVAERLKEIVPEEYVLREIYGFPNPEQMMRKKDVERAERENPYQAWRKRAHALAEEGAISDAWAAAYVARKYLIDIMTGVFQPQQQDMRGQQQAKQPENDGRGGRTAPQSEEAKAMREMATMEAA